MYDGSITAEDPFPDRDTFEGGDPTLWGMTRVFASGINLWLREHLGVFVIHGVFHLVTPYTTSKRILSNMKLTREMNSRVTFRTVSGGHMFYTWDVSRAELRKEAEHFVERFGLAR